MQAYPMNAAAVEITPADRQWWASHNTEAHDQDATTPVDALAEPNPRDGWPGWVDDDVFELGPEDGMTDRDWDDLAEERWSPDDSGYPDDSDMAWFRS